MKIKITDKFITVDISTDRKKIDALIELEDSFEFQDYCTYVTNKDQYSILDEVQKYLLGLDYDSQVIIPEDSDSKSKMHLRRSEGLIPIIPVVDNNFIIDEYDIECGNLVRYYDWDSDKYKFSSIDDYRKYRISEFKNQVSIAETKIEEFFTELSKDLKSKGIIMHDHGSIDFESVDGELNS